MPNRTENKSSAPGQGAAQLPIAVEADERRVRRGFWPKFWRTVGKVPFSEDLAAGYYCAVDPLTPARIKGVLFAALAYFVAPADLIPDVIAAVGFTDDATVLATVMGLVSAHIRERHRTAARHLLQSPPQRTPA